MTYKWEMATTCILHCRVSIDCNFHHPALVKLFSRNRKCWKFTGRLSNVHSKKRSYAFASLTSICSPSNKSRSQARAEFDHHAQMLYREFTHSPIWCSNEFISSWSPISADASYSWRNPSGGQRCKCVRYSGALTSPMDEF